MIKRSLWFGNFKTWAERLAQILNKDPNADKAFRRMKRNETVLLVAGPTVTPVKTSVMAMLQSDLDAIFEPIKTITEEAVITEQGCNPSPASEDFDSGMFMLIEPRDKRRRK